MPKTVFISYRREDTAGAAGRLYDRLSRLLSKSNVFFDVSTMGGGEDFEKRIATEVDRADAAIILIGDKWLEPVQPTRKARIWEEGDYVRAEIRGALARAILVLPVLVAGARMPKLEQLPQDVRAITTKIALPLRYETFDDDAENILAAVLGTPARQRAWEDKGKWSKVAYAVGGAIVTVSIILIGALAHFWVLENPLSASIGEPVTTLMLIISPIVGAWLGFRYEAWKRRL